MLTPVEIISSEKQSSDHASTHFLGIYIVDRVPISPDSDNIGSSVSPGPSGSNAEEISHNDQAFPHGD